MKLLGISQRIGIYLIFKRLIPNLVPRRYQGSRLQSEFRCERLTLRHYTWFIAKSGQFHANSAGLRVQR